MNETAKETRKNPKTIPSGSFKFLIIMGIIVILGALTFLRFSLSTLKGFEKVTANVTSVTGGIYVSYTYNGVKYNNVQVNMTTPPEIGHSLVVYVNPDSPDKADSNQTSKSIFIVLTVFGSVSLACGVFGLILRRKLVGPEDKIILDGKYIYADVTQVVYETGIKDDNGRHPYILHCHYEDFTGRKKEDYVSPPIYTNPQPYLAVNKNKVKIYIKGNNLKKYRFDLSQFENVTG